MYFYVMVYCHYTFSECAWNITKYLFGDSHTKLVLTNDVWKFFLLLNIKFNHNLCEKDCITKMFLTLCGSLMRFLRFSVSAQHFLFSETNMKYTNSFVALKRLEYIQRNYVRHTMNLVMWKFSCCITGKLICRLHFSDNSKLKKQDLISNQVLQ